MGISTWSNIWMYLVADFVGGAVAALVFNMINPPAQIEPIPTQEPPYKTP
jgi:aquaporin Z